MAGSGDLTQRIDIKTGDKVRIDLKKRTANILISEGELAERRAEMEVIPAAQQGSTLDAHVGNLAYHAYEAGNWAKALEYTRLEGEKAQALYAPHAALDHFTRALEAARHVAARQHDRGEEIVPRESPRRAGEVRPH